MAARCILVFCGLWLSVTGGGICPAQEVTAEEVVARHEASWAKLKRLYIVMETTSRMTVGGSSVRLGDHGERVTDFSYQRSESSTVSKWYIAEDRFSATHRITAKFDIGTEEGGDEEIKVDTLARESHLERKEVFDKGVLFSIRPARVHIQSKPKSYPRIDHYLLGRRIACYDSWTGMSLGEWVAEAHPTIKRIVNASGEECFLLEGEFKSNQTPHREPTFRTDLVKVVVNAKRGYLIEQVDFACEKQAHGMGPKETHLTVSKWLELGDGMSFPARVKANLIFWNIPDKNWVRVEVKDAKIDPVDLEEQFKIEFPEDSMVFDNSDRPGVPAVYIWGGDDKPKKSFATRKDYDAYELEQHVAKMFPGCNVKATWDASRKDFQTTVFLENGEVLREFTNSGELATVESVQELIRFAMGKKDLK